MQQSVQQSLPAGNAEVTRVAPRLFVTVVVLDGLSGCAREKPSESEPLRVGHLYVNGNCAIDSENKLTGLCEGSGKTGCITHEPDPTSPPCKVGLAVKETRTPACATATSQELVSREHQCFFVDR
jgi:hypothetical protein